MNLLDYQAMIWGYETPERQAKLETELALTKAQAREFLALTHKVIEWSGLSRWISTKSDSNASHN